MNENAKFLNPVLRWLLQAVSQYCAISTFCPKEPARNNTSITTHELQLLQI